MRKISDLTPSSFLDMADMTLSSMLLLIAAVLIGIALIPDHHIEKAIVLAWVLLP